ncbi:7533_t:CDS:2, partial [Gigaspora margarita]
KKPHFKIIFGSDPDDFVCSNLSATTVANAFITVYNKKKADKAKSKGLIPKSKINRVFLFGFQLKQIKEFHEKKAQIRLLKPFNDLSNRIQITRGKIELKELAFSVNNNKFRITYRKNYQELQQLAVIKATDKNQISQAAY